MTTETVTLVVPWGQKRSFKLVLPPHVAEWLRDELADVLGEPRPKPRRAVRLRRGAWQEKRRVRSWTK